MKTIKEIEIGYTFYNNLGKCTVIDKKKRTLTIMYENGNTVKNTYRYFDSYFYTSDL